MVNFRSLTLSLSTITGLAFASPIQLQSRAVIAHDAVVGFAETVPSGIEGTLYLKYKPYLKVFNGCVPYPAVQANGDTSGGLDNTGDPSGDCSNSTGQVYARAGAYNGSYAIMYSWYMPKDEPSTGIGHRHDWENIVVWLSSESTSATIRGVAVSQHGGYSKSTSPDLSGTRPTIGYISYYPLDHQLIETTTVGGEEPLIAWESLTDAARTALEDTDFGSATVPFKSNFETYLAEAEI